MNDEQAKQWLASVLWTCHICKDTRQDGDISVYQTDLSKINKLPKGSMMMNIRYCNDRPSCLSGAKSFTFFDNETT